MSTVNVSRFWRQVLRFGCDAHQKCLWRQLNRQMINVDKWQNTINIPGKRLMSTENHMPPTPVILDPIVMDKLDQTTTFTKDERKEFLAELPDIIRSLTIEGNHADMPLVNQHLGKCIQYNATKGKLNRGLMVPHTFRLLTKPDEQTPDNIRRSIILGWCVELLQGFFLVADDIMDGSTTRRGQECWYKLDNIGMTAVNDSILLETCIYTLLHTHFSDQPNYLDTLDAFLYTTRHTAMGQALDILSAYSQDESKRKCNLDDFTMKRYASIIKHKTSYYSFYLPVQLGMGLAGVRDPELYRQARTILLEMGHFFQVQDDYLDCYGDPKVTGKVGTDIIDGKCSWIIVVALQRATKEQKKILRKTYGSSDAEDVATVRRVFDELNLQKVYRSYEEQTVQEIIDLINRMSGGSENRTLNPVLFKSILSKIYKRNR